MLVFAGLGNPGPAHALHRHNIGFMAVDAIHHRHGFGPWKAAHQGMLADGRLAGVRVLLLKPMTFMNESGRAVASLLRFFKLELAALTVFYDELDLEPFRVKVKVGGGAAGHNGLRSIDAHLGQGYRRVRIGIGHPGHRDRVTPHVLGNWAKAEMAPLEALLADIADLAPLLVAGDEDARFMSDLAARRAQEA